ncbi:MAG TPA: oligogalacturonate lyase family protein [Bryobacteraceae bacterium]|nr:oligogalacturonate lyase family protein [Bryobacteraceae bacterium]
MAGLTHRISRRVLLAGLAASPRLWAVGTKGNAFPSEWTRYPDPATELEVLRLTDPEHTSVLPAFYNRAIARNGSFLLYSSDREGSPQAFRMDLKTGGLRQLTDVEGLDEASLTLTPDNRSFCYFAGRALFVSPLTTLRERQMYAIPDGWERRPGMTVGPDGTHVTFIEGQGETSRLRVVPFAPGPARTVVETPFPIADPIPRPMRAQILYRQGNDTLWLVNLDGQQAHKLKVAEGGIGAANWASDGKTLLYLNFPTDTKQLNTIREHIPDTNTDRLVGKTSQFIQFGPNRDTTVFVGASRNIASPYVLILLRVTHRELTLCEHKASRPDTVNPMFSPDSQRIFFQSDRHGKPAIYSMHVQKFVEKTESDTIG